MAQLDEAAAGTEAEVVETAPEIQGTETNEASDAESFYAEDLPEGGDGAEEDDFADDDAPEPIAAPVSLKAEEKEQFAQLPPEAQRFTSEILARRDRETQQGLETARLAQQEAQRSAADQVATAQRDFAQRFERVVSAFRPQAPSPEMARENPSEYLYAKARYDEEIASFESLIGQVGQLTGQSDAHFQQRQQEWMAEQVNQLRSIPEIVDDAKRPQFLADIRAIGIDLGFTDEDLSQVSAKDVFALNKVRTLKAKADKWDAHQKQRNNRPRTVQGRFSAAPGGGVGAANGGGPNATLKALYPND